MYTVCNCMQQNESRKSIVALVSPVGCTDCELGRSRCDTSGLEKMAVTKIYAPSAFKITSSQHFQRHLGCLLNWVQQLARRENHMACGTRWSNLCNLVSEDLLWFVFVLICHDLSVSNTFNFRGHQAVPDFRKPEPVSNTTENFCSGFPTSEVSRNSSKEAVHSPLLSFANEEISWLLK